METMQIHYSGGVFFYPHYATHTHVGHAKYTRSGKTIASKLTRNPFSLLTLIGLLLVEYLNLAVFSLVSQKATNARINWAIKNLLEDSVSSFSILAFASIASLLVIYHLCNKGQKEGLELTSVLLAESSTW